MESPTHFSNDTAKGIADIRVLTPEDTEAFASMTYGASRRLLPLCRPPLLSGGGDGSVAIGAGVPAQDGGVTPVGLALAEIHPQRPSAVIRSLYVEEPWRMRGIGTRLLQALEAELSRRGVRVAGAVYVSDSPGFAATEAVLRHCGWTVGTPRMRLGRFSIDRILKLPWLSLKPGPAHEIIPWQDVTARERDAIRTWPDFPTALSPFSEPALQEPRVSTALRVRETGCVIGWMITHRVLPDTVRYSALYVRPDVPVLGRGMPILAAAISRQGEARNELLHALAGVAVANEAMSAALMRRLGPFSEGIATSYEARKELAV